MACLAIVLAALATAVEPQYVFINKAPGIEWHQAHPETFTPESLEAIVDAIGAPRDGHLRIGVTFTFSTLQTPVEVLAESLRNLLEAGESTGIPVMVGFDGQNWWGERPDLWNWWDPDKPGYNPANAHNVEWTEWNPASAVKLGWRNWGSQLRVHPQPNLASPAVIAAHVEPLKALAPIVAAWYRGLPAERRYLLGGVKVGHEAGIGYNAFYYPDGNTYLERWPDDTSHDPRHGLDLKAGLSGGAAQLGYAAVKTAGIKHEGTITREDLGKVTQRYLTTLAKAVHDCGLPRERIYTHQGGTYPPWGAHYPFWPAINVWSTPGWSFYGLDPHACEGLAEALDDAGCDRWAAVEWWWGAPDADTWRDHFERTLGFRDCRFLAVFNWNCGFAFQNEPAGHEALRRLVKERTGHR
ncbi:MAG TPA: hypothetical protein ENN80_09010 [Candidatus Hydrogenedentes bacterium]|nr:hypothetical protein [Candidatus Hydrogenedentota bacterium]